MTPTRQQVIEFMDHAAVWSEWDWDIPVSLHDIAQDWLDQDERIQRLRALLQESLALTDTAIALVKAAPGLPHLTEDK
jgi:hypothetical protein